MLVVVLVLYARHGERFTRESAAGRIGTGMLLGMLGFAFVWLAQLPFGLVQLWWDRRHDVSEVRATSSGSSTAGSRLGGVFLFVCAAIVIVMALARPLRDQWWIPGAAVFVGARPAVHVRLARTSCRTSTPLRNDRGSRRRPTSSRASRASPDIPVKVEDVDEFTDEPNAFATGLGPTRRVILWNTLLDPPFSDREVRVVIAHELGHHSRDHIWKSFGWFALVRRADGAAGRVCHAAPGRDVRRPRRAARAARRGRAPGRGRARSRTCSRRRYEAEADWVALETGPGSRARSASCSGT